MFSVLMGSDVRLEGIGALLLVKGMFGVVDGVVQSAALLAFEGLAGDEVTDVDHVAEFADVLCRLDALEQVFGLFVEQVETRTMPT